MFNNATILGRVGKKDTQTLKNGSDVTVLSVVTTKNFKSPTGEKKETTTWHRVSCFGKLHDIANKYVQIGDIVFIRGEIQHKQMEHGEKAGQFIYSLNAEDIRFIPKANKSFNNSKTDNKEKTNFEFSDEVMF